MLFELIRKSLQRRKPAAELSRLALEHHARGDLAQAEDCFREAARRTPSDVSAWINLAATMVSQHKYAAAIPVLQEVIELEPQLAEAHLDLGLCHNRQKDNTAAIRHYRKAIELKPDLATAHANIVNAYLDCCDWDAVDLWSSEFLDYRRNHPVEQWARRLDPFCAISLFPGEVARELATERAASIARSIAGERLPPPVARGTGDGRIRLGYVSADLRDHAIGHLTAGLYAAHDRSRFEVYAYSMGATDGSEYRARIERGCDRFVDVRNEHPDATAQRIRDDGIDVLVDMMGHTSGGRLRIFAHRPAPIQVAYLGYPGTTGARYIDYVISDRVATPPGCESEFTEKLALLPGCYQVNDDRQPISPEPCARADFGLPDAAFVYCCFNMPRKIDRRIFTAWTEILRTVPEGVLWILGDDPQAEVNLRREAGNQGVDPGRLIFAGRAHKPVHLARHRLADLFLDTCAYNAHTTASDALWAGLPLITFPGETFARRVAASILTAAALPELIARDIADYQRLAVRLARERELLEDLKNRLERNRTACALFDTAGYVRQLEAAYLAMARIQRAGRAPESFAV